MSDLAMITASDFCLTPQALPHRPLGVNFFCAIDGQFLVQLELWTGQTFRSSPKLAVKVSNTIATIATIVYRKWFTSQLTSLSSQTKSVRFAGHVLIGSTKVQKLRLFWAHVAPLRPRTGCFDVSAEEWDSITHTHVSWLHCLPCLCVGLSDGHQVG